MQYIKIKDAIVEQIEQGTLLAGQKLPSERQLAESFHTTRVTLREALSLLESDGLVYREDRRGWFIAPERLRFPLSVMGAFSQLAIEQNRIPGEKLISVQRRLANKQAIQQMNLAPFSEVYCVHVLRFLEKRPIAYATYWIQSEHCDGLRETAEGTIDMSEIDIFALLQQSPSLPISNIRDRVMVSSLFGDIALALRATPGTPAILLERLIYSGSDVIALEVSTWRHDALLVESTMG